MCREVGRKVGAGDQSTQGRLRGERTGPGSSPSLTRPMGNLLRLRMVVLCEGIGKVYIYDEKWMAGPWELIRRLYIREGL